MRMQVRQPSRARRHLSLAALIGVTILLAGACQSAGPKAPADNASMPVPVPERQYTAADLQKLRWLEGQWRGEGGGASPFYERYHFASDDLLETASFPDSAMTKPTGQGVVKLENGLLIHRGDDGSTWVATKLDERTIHFAPKEKARNTFAWERESADVWRARLNVGQSNERVYRMERIKP